ncbi:hypothetical protein J7J41_01070 [bacterium]|nr:hypothetical protein [bacterium]
MLFLLIDANALIHRVFYALPHLTTKNKEPIQAVYGFFSVLLKILKEVKPNYIAACFDLPSPTFRHKRYKEYKATRPKTPEELSSQIPKIKEGLKFFNVKIFEKEGYEADDFIDTLSKKISEKFPEAKIIILSGDLDTLQVVRNEKIVVMSFKKGITETKIYDEKEIMKKFGLKPFQVPDFKALCGDPSDNIPGVKGVGKKTAQKLLEDFETIENLYSQLEKNSLKFKKYSKKIIESLKESKNQAFFSKFLATTRCDVPVKFSLEELKINPLPQKIKEFFKKYEFFSLIKRADEVFKEKISQTLF